MEYQTTVPHKALGPEDQIIRVLKRSEIFLGQDDCALGKIAGLPGSRYKLFKAGTVVFRQGTQAEDMFILDTGKVKLTMDLPQPRGQAKTLAVDTILKGGLFGWSAIVPPFIYTKTATCEEDSSAVSFNGAELNALFEEEPNIGYKAMKDFSHIIAWRLRQLENLLIAARRSPIF